VTAEIPDFLFDYWQRRENARAEAVTAFLESLTERERALFQDGAVMGFVRGSLRSRDEEIPLNKPIVAEVVNACFAFPELYPAVNGYVPAPLCAECGHPQDEHEGGDDPVSPGTCATCRDDEDEAAHHNFQQPVN
jgi:hypothetical protein